MTKLITVENDQTDKGSYYCDQLESGNILFFPKVPFSFPQEDIDFLLEQRQTGNTSRKNIAYKPHIDKVTNVVSTSSSKIDQDRLLEIMRNYTHNVNAYISQLLSPYASSCRLDYSSFRPFQEKGRNLRMSARNDLLHIDAFPSRPMHGTRILRFFTNINPDEPRRWVTSDSFDVLAEKFAGKDIAFPKRYKSSMSANFLRTMKRFSKWAGLPVVLRSPYDEFMLRFHHFLKANEDFQNNCEKFHWEFPPGSCWAVFTDLVTHAALEGKYALEQTLLIPKSAQLNPEKSPLSVLERLSGEIMVDPVFAGPKLSR